MADSFDVLVLGGGIAASGLVFNLRRAGFEGTVAVLEKDVPGGAKAYGFRNTFQSVIEEYQIPYRKVFRGLRDGITTGNSDIQWKDIDIPCYFFEYGEACEALLSGTGAVFHKGTAVSLDMESKRLGHSGGEIGFGILVDCSGPMAWSRAPLGLPKVSRYYIGKTFSLPRSLAGILPDFFDESRFIYYTEANGYMEDAYVLGDQLLFGVWNYSPTPAPEIGIRDGGLLSKFACFPEMLRCRPYPAAISAEPVYPIVHGSVAYLGDSCGQATPASSEGTRPILDASRILAETIARNRSLDSYQDEWFRKTAREYSLHRAMKLEMRNYNKFFARLRNHPEVYRDLALNLNPRIPFGILLSSFPYLFRAYLAGRREYSMHKKRIRERIPMME